MSRITVIPREDVPRTVKFPCLRLRQPVGEFYVGRMKWKDLCQIADFDVRRLIRDEREVESYLGVQRPLNPRRVDELQRYVNLKDAAFPTGIIIAVKQQCASFDDDNGEMTLSSYVPETEDEEPVLFKDIARVIDGQHRIKGLEGFKGSADGFDVAVTVLVGMDIADQAYIFSTVNLLQTKVNKSLAYDLFELQQTRSPQKTCHNIAVALDREDKSPFHRRVKRLGVATEERNNETLTQAQVVECTLWYISRDPIADRDALLRKRSLSRVTGDEQYRYFFRNWFIDDEDLKILDVIWNYFDAVRTRWPKAWASFDRGNILNRTNGFRALMRLLKPAYHSVAQLGEVPGPAKFGEVFGSISLDDNHFTSERFRPGTSGEVLLFRTLSDEAKLTI